MKKEGEEDAKVSDSKDQEGLVSQDFAVESHPSIKKLKVTLTDKSVVTFCEHCHNLYKENYKCDYCA